MLLPNATAVLHFTRAYPLFYSLQSRSRKYVSNKVHHKFTLSSYISIGYIFLF